MMARRLRMIVGKYREERRNAVKAAQLREMREREAKMNAEAKEARR